MNWGGGHKHSICGKGGRRERQSDVMWKRAIGAFETGQGKARNTAGRSWKDEGTWLWTL